MNCDYEFDPETCTHEAEFLIEYREPWDNNEINKWRVCKVCGEILFEGLHRDQIEYTVKELKEVVIFS